MVIKERQQHAPTIISTPMQDIAFK